MGRHWGWMAVCAIPWLALLGLSRPPEPSLSDWITWRDGQIERILEPTFDDHGEKILAREEVIRRCAETYQVLAPYLQNQQFLKDPAQAKALGNFTRFVATQARMAVPTGSAVSPSSLAMDISDRDYWNYARLYVQFPSLLASQPFLKLLSSPNGYKAAVDMIEVENAKRPPEKRWLVAPLRTQFIKSVDKTTYGRLLVYVPNEADAGGNILDRWFFFAISTPDQEGVEEESVSAIGVVRNPAKPGQNLAYFSDFLRYTNPVSGAIRILPNFLLESNPSKNCYECHKTAVLPIHAKTMYRFDSDGTLVEDPTRVGALADLTDRLIRTYGRTDWGHLDAGDYGPSFGPAIPRTEPTAKVKEAMNCTGCHQDLLKIDYMVAVRSDRDSKSFEGGMNMVQSYIEKGFMPPGNTLSPSERHALWESLEKEYFDPVNRKGLLVDWLKGN